MRIRLEDDEAVEVQMAPLIDCVFLLLIFFLIASTLKKTVKELPLELPEAAAAVSVPQEKDVLVVSVDRDGTTYINAEPVTTQTLLDRVAEAAAADPAAQFRIDADRVTPYAYVIRIIDELQFRGFTNVGLHTMDATTRREIDRLQEQQQQQQPAP